MAKLLNVVLCAMRVMVILAERAAAYCFAKLMVFVVPLFFPVSNYLGKLLQLCFKPAFFCIVHLIHSASTLLGVRWHP